MMGVASLTQTRQRPVRRGPHAPAVWGGPCFAAFASPRNALDRIWLQVFDGIRAWFHNLFHVLKKTLRMKSISSFPLLVIGEKFLLWM